MQKMGLRPCFFLLKKTLLKNDQQNNPDGNGRIGDVKNRAEEDKRFSGPEWKPGGHGPLDDGKIKHIDHLAVEKSGITSAFGHEFGDAMIGTLTEQKTVKSAVDDVSESAGKDKAQADDQARFGLFFRQADEVPANGDHGNDTENTQGQLAEFSGKLNTESHSVVFGKMDDEPVDENRNFLPDGHSGFDPELEDLVGHQDRQNDYDGFFQGLFSCLLGFVGMLYCWFFASMLSVAWGTLFSLSLEISLPVTLQMP